METDAERVRRKLKALLREHSVETLAAQAGMSPGYLKQIIAGTKLQDSGNERGLHANSRRKIEAALGLERGWFDNDEGATFAGKRFSALALDLAGLFDELALAPSELHSARSYVADAITAAGEQAALLRSRAPAGKRPPRRRASGPRSAPDRPR